MSKEKFKTVEVPKEQKEQEVTPLVEMLSVIFNKPKDEVMKFILGEYERIMKKEKTSLTMPPDTRKRIVNVLNPVLPPDAQLPENISLPELLLAYRNNHAKLQESLYLSVNDWAPPADDRDLIQMLIKRFGVPRDWNQSEANSSEI